MISIFFSKINTKKATYTFSSAHLQDNSLQKCIELCKKFNTNLVIANFYFCCDPETAKYRGRVYCIDGMDNRFPNLTDTVLNCKLSFSPFIYGVSVFDVYTHKCDPIKFSNRPFKDDRTIEEITTYNEKINLIKLAEKDKADYNWLCEHLPDYAPKSYGGYRNMKARNSANYQKLICLAEEKGYLI